MLSGHPVLFAMIDGHVKGGTIGLADADLLARLAGMVLHEASSSHRRPTLIIGFDTGGVRVEEGPRALAAASAIGVALARLSLQGVPLIGVVSGPRGCFGAPSVMAGIPEHRIIVAKAHWGLTGPRLFGDLDPQGGAEAGYAATSATTRLANGDASAVVDDSAKAIRADLAAFLASAAAQPSLNPHERIAQGTEFLCKLRERLRTASPAERQSDTEVRRRRDLLRYSFRGKWQMTGPARRAGLVHASLGLLGGRPALGLIVGPERVERGGVGIEEAALITEMIRQVTDARGEERAAILIFLFCQGHAVDLEQERFGLPRALAECLRAMVTARVLGHPIVSVLGGGTYGAAYLALAAPSHRILAMRGTSVAPMAPQVLRAFQALRGSKRGPDERTQLAELVPEIRIVESVIRLPRVLGEELPELWRSVRPELEVV